MADDTDRLRAIINEFAWRSEDDLGVIDSQTVDVHIDVLGDDGIVHRGIFRCMDSVDLRRALARFQEDPNWRRPQTMEAEEI